MKHSTVWDNPTGCASSGKGCASSIKAVRVVESGVQLCPEFSGRTSSEEVQAANFCFKLVCPSGVNFRTELLLLSFL